MCILRSLWLAQILKIKFLTESSIIDIVVVVVVVPSSSAFVETVAADIVLVKRN